MGMDQGADFLDPHCCTNLSNNLIRFLTSILKDNKRI